MQSPSTRWHVISPPKLRIPSWQNASPIPVPCSLVVVNPSNKLATVSCATPPAVSLTRKILNVSPNSVVMKMAPFWFLRVKFRSQLHLLLELRVVDRVNL